MRDSRRQAIRTEVVVGGTCRRQQLQPGTDGATSTVRGDSEDKLAVDTSGKLVTGRTVFNSCTYSQMV